MQTSEEYITVAQLEKLLNVSHQFIYKHLHTRRLPGMVKIGRAWRFRKSEVEKRLAEGELLLPEEETK